MTAAVTLSLISGVRASTDDSTRVEGRILADRLVSDASLQRGQVVTVRWIGEHAPPVATADGLIEGLMAWGLTVKSEPSGTTRGSFLLEISRGVRSETQGYAVRLQSLETNTFILVREYSFPEEDDGLLESWGVSAVITGVVALVVYLLLTVRSS